MNTHTYISNTLSSQVSPRGTGILYKSLFISDMRRGLGWSPIIIGEVVDNSDNNSEVI